MTPAPQVPGPPGPLRGVALLATGRARGIEGFRDTPQAFLASLAPLLAFPLVGAMLLLFAGRGGDGLAALLWTLVALLAPPVISHALARRWNRDAEWLRYATALNWCQWAIPVIGFLLILAVQLATAGSMPEEAMAELVLMLLALYFLWLHWMVARHGLSLGRLRAVGMVALVNFGTAALLILPRLAAFMVNGYPANGSGS